MENNIGEARRAYAGKVGGFTQENAAKYFGVSLSTYKKWEQGQGMMNGEQLRAIARKYAVSVDYLLQIERKQDIPPLPEFPLSEDEYAVVQSMRRMDAQGRAELAEYAAFLQARHPLNQAVAV